MRFEGNVWKDGKFWLIELPALDLMTQGKTKKEALAMIQDALNLLMEDYGFKANVDVIDNKHGSFSVSSNNSKALVATMLRRQRARQGLTLKEVAQRMASKYPNAYAQYEQAKAAPTLDMLNKILLAINPNIHPVLKLA